MFVFNTNLLVPCTLYCTHCTQGDIVRRLKEDNKPKLEVTAAVAELKVRKKALEAKEKSLAPQEEKFDRGGLDELMKRRFFVAPSYSIYGGGLDQCTIPRMKCW